MSQRLRRRVLVTGMSATGKSSALSELAGLGFEVVDSDEPGVDRVVRRRGWILEHRTTNSYGKSPEQRALVLEHLSEVEPLLRRTCTHEIDAAQPLAAVVALLAALAT